jgi:hypothetical protein
MGSQATPASPIQSATDTTTPATTAASPRPSFPPSNQGNNNYRCFNCGSPSHFIKDCPQPRKSFQGQASKLNNKGKKQMVQVRQGRVNFTTLSEFPEGAPIITVLFLSTINPWLYFSILV